MRFETMKTLSLRLPDTLHARLAAVARQRKTTKAAIVRDALNAFVNGGSRIAKGSAYELAEDLIGSLSGPRDLSSNPRHMEGYGG